MQIILELVNEFFHFFAEINVRFLESRKRRMECREGVSVGKRKRKG